ncbi:MAG: TIGR02996 domain-containing protein [Polyangiales bacterium]
MDERSMLEAIRAAPEDDAPRLVLADWLTERGDPRGELIVVQCELARGELSREERRARRAREAEILAKLPPLSSEIYGTYVRGLVDGVGLDVEVFLARGAEIFEKAPLVRCVRIFGLSADDTAGSQVGAEAVLSRIDRLCASPLLANVRGLGFGNVGVHWESDSEFTPTGFNGFGDALVERLVRSPYLRGLSQLAITGSDLGPTGARALASCVALAGLESLDLRQHVLGSEGMRALFERTIFPRLRRLSLAGKNGSPRTMIDFRELARMPGLASVVDLDVGMNWSAHPEDIVASPYGRSLRRLTLHSGLGWGVRQKGRSEVEIRRDEIRVLEGIARPGNRLAHLDLGGNISLTDEHAHALASFRSLSHLKSLVVTHARIEPSGARALASSQHLQGLESLDLRGNYLCGGMQSELERLTAAEVLVDPPRSES